MKVASAITFLELFGVLDHPKYSLNTTGKSSYSINNFRLAKTDGIKQSSMRELLHMESN